MIKSLFAIELPLVKTDKELEKIKQIYSQYDPYFIVSGCCKERREIFDRLWKNYQSYADSHFLNQIRTNFHQRSWEMYIGNVLLKKGLIIQSKNKGPDFVIDKTAYVECVAPTKGDPAKHDSVPEMHVATKLEEIHVQDVPVDKMVLRITQAIKDKALDQYGNWRNKELVDLKTPFIIAVNTGDFGHVENPSMPNVVKALFGFQFMEINIKTGATSFSHRDKIEKTNGKPVSVNYFVDNNFSFVSGVLFSDKTILDHPENIGDDCIFVNNPFAEYPVNNEFSKLFKGWFASKDHTGIHLKKGY